MSIWLNASYVIWILEDGRVVYVRNDRGSKFLKAPEIGDATYFASAAAAWQFIRARPDLQAKVECGYAGVSDTDCRFVAIGQQW